MNFKLSKISNETNWIEGTIGDYNFTAKHYDEVSDYGINGGRVSKLEIWNGEYDFNKVLVNYDRGWDIDTAEELTNETKELTGKIKEVVEELLSHLENLPKRFNSNGDFTTEQISNFKEFESVRKSGVINMFDSRSGCEITGLTKEEWTFCMGNYKKLKEQYDQE